MNILLAGGGGLIGTALAEQLRAGGGTVTRLVRGPTHGGAPGHEVAWDPVRGTVDLPRLEQAGPFLGVVNLAGAGIGDRRWSPSRRRLVVESRVGLTRLLVDTMAQLSTPPAVLVSASAVGFYGDRGDEVLTEDSAGGAGFLADLCRAWEEAAGSAARPATRVVLLRSGIVLTRAGGALAKQLPVFRLGLGARMGAGDQYRSWISLPDEIAVLMRCLEDESISGPVNACSPEPVTDRALAQAVATALHRPAVLAVPATALRLALGGQMADELVLGGQRVLPAVLQATGFEFAHRHVEGALRAELSNRP